ncbi:MAG TPA: hypothetical protein DCP53_01110 [Elusimicrobia bacterium]|nr:hypothetical protein [Elusimicrobiota bacterium]
MKLLFEFIIFPGFIFTAILGMLVSWIDRKVTARIQWRQGPPLLQPYYDLEKLLIKETIIPENANALIFLISPLIAIISTTIVSLIIWKTIFNPQSLFIGDLIVVIYLLALTPIAVILGASASGNPIASLAASREMKLFMSYELPFIFSILVPVIKAHSIKLGEIIIYQQSTGMIFNSISGILASAIFLITIHAKLGLVPFDIAEAETELAGGVFIEYSGTPLALHKLNRIMLLFVVPVFAVILFLGGMHPFYTGILKYLVVVVLIILIKNTNPRLRIDQAIKFFWRRCTMLSILAIILAIKGF